MQYFWLLKIDIYLLSAIFIMVLGFDCILASPEKLNFRDYSTLDFNVRFTVYIYHIKGLHSSTLIAHILFWLGNLYWVPIQTFKLNDIIGHVWGDFDF
jgi:hypothetical protein